MAEQDIFSLLGEDDKSTADDMSDINPTLGVTQAASTSATPSQAAPPKQQQQPVAVTANVLTGKDPLMSQGVGAAVASQLTSVQVKQMTTPVNNPMWGSQTSKAQTIVLQQGAAKQTVSHHDYAQKQTVQTQLQQQKNIQQQLQLSQQQQQQIKQQLQQLQQKQLQIQQQQQLQQIQTVQPQQAGQQQIKIQQLQPGGFQQLQGGQRITLSGLQQKIIQQSPTKLTPPTPGSPQQTIIRLPVSLSQLQQQQSLNLTPSSTTQTITIQQPKTSVAGVVTAGGKLQPQVVTAGGTPRYIITRQAGTQGNQPVTLQLNMQDVNKLQQSIGKLQGGKLQTLPGGQVIRIQPAAQQQGAAVQTVLQQQQQNAAVQALLQQQQGAAVQTVLQQQQTQQAGVKTILQQQQGQQKTIIQQQQVQQPAVKTVLQQQPGATVQTLLQQQQGSAVKALLQQQLAAAVKASANKASPVRQASPARQVSPARQASPVRQASPIRQAAPQTQRVITLTPQQLQQLMQRSQGGAGGLSLSLPVLQQNTTQSPATSTGQVMRTVLLPQASTAATSTGQVVRTLVAPQSAASSVATTQIQSVNTAAGVATQNLNLLASQAAGATSATQILQKMIVPQSVAVSTVATSKPVLLTSQASTKPVFSQVGGKTMVVNQAGVNKSVVFSQAGGKSIMLNQATGKPVFLTNQPGGKPIFLTTQAGGKQVLITNPAGGQQTGGKQVLITNQAGGQQQVILSSPSSSQAKPMMLSPTQGKTVTITSSPQGTPSLVLSPTRTQQPAKAKTVTMPSQAVFQLPTGNTQGLTLSNISQTIPQTPPKTVISQTTISSPSKPQLTFSATSSIPPLAPISTTNTTVSTTQVVNKITPVVTVTTSASIPSATLITTQSVVSSPAVMSTATSQLTLAASQQSVTQSPTKIVTSTAAAGMPPLQLLGTAAASQSMTPISAAADSKAVTNATIATSVAAAQPALTSAVGTSSAAATPTAAVATPAATSVTVPKTTPSTQAPGGKITISSATAQMLAQKGIVLTRTPQGTFVAKIPQSMLLKAAAQGQLSQGAGKQAAGVSLLNKLQTTGAQAAKSGAGAKSPKAAQPTIVTTKGKKIKSPTRVSSPAASTSTASAPKIVYTIGGQQIAASSLTSGSTDQKQKMVLTLKPGMSAAEEVKKIGMELGKLQGQSKTPENLQKLKDLHGKLKQLQLSVQTSAAIAAKVKLDASSSKSSAEDTDVDLPKDERERKKIIKQRQLQDKANRIVAEAVAKAKASGLKDIPKIMINVKLPEVTEEELQLQQQKPKKEKSKKSKSSKPKSSKLKRPKSPKPPKPPKERKKVQSIIKKPKKLPLAALNKLKKQRKKLMPGLDESDSSEYDETPPPTPDPELDEFVEKRRSSRNTDKRKKYTVDYDFNITDDSSSSDDNNDPNKVKKPKEKKMKTERTQVISKESEDGENNLEIDVETVEPTMLAEQAKFFVDNPDESQANVVEKILSRRTVKKPQLPGEAQVGEVEEFFVKYKSYSYLHCEWCTQDKLLKGDQRIPQKIRRFRAKQHTAASYLQDLDDEPFNPDFLEVERVIDKAITEDPDNPGQMVTHFLIKWRSQPYEDATWEVPDDVDKEKVAIYERFSKIPPVSERKRVPRGRLTSWDKMEESRTYKNENTLREYQLEGVNWLVFSWFNGQNCILADEMGLGKTIQAITFLEEVKKTGIIGPFLVIAPLSTIGNWQREFDTWTDVNCVVYHGSSQSRHMIAEYEMYFKNDKGLIIPNIYKFQVLITTYEIVLADCQELSEIEWRVVIIDEAHRLKNRNCKLLEGLKILDLEHRVLLTGTPLQNNVEELFSLLNFLEPGQFRSSTQFMEDFGDLKSESQVEKLQGILRPMMLRRLKEDVEKNLAPKEETIVEVELTNIQKKYYRAILERNFNFLNKGTNSSANLPNLMNTMMELRKCCNHPFLINGAEEQIMMEFQNLPPEEMPYRHVKALVQSAGKMVLLDKLLPKLKEGGHKVLIFSQMIRCLDILEDYLITKQYAFERIDGRVRGNMRQAAIDRFSKPDSDRFVFLLCTRAGGLGINLTAADTCVIFDSDWNPQNDLQAQARCHRIGQKKSVKIYRLITRNSYEREMFDKASLKLGLDKAVLQSMRSGADKNEQGAPVQNLSKTEIEDLLKRGAYGAIMDDDDAASKFCEEDIDQILQRRTQIIKIEAGEKGSTFAKASFSLSGEKHASEIKLDDPDFWEKWAKRADLDVDQMKNKENMIIDAPRQRKQTRRYGNMDDMVQLSDEDSDFHSDDNDGKPGAEGGGGGGGGGGTKKGKGKGHKKQQQQQQALLQPEVPCKKQLQSGWTRLECFRVEKGLLTYGWGRWNDIISTTRFKRRLGEKDIEAISRTMLIYCLLHYKGDENIKSFIWDLVTPSPDGTVKDYKNHKGLSAPVPRGRKGRKPKKEEAVVPAILEYDFNNRDQDPETLLTDQGYKNHLKRHCNKVLLRVRLLYYLKQEVIGDAVEQIEQGVNASELPINMPAPEGEPPISWWDEAADRSLMVGVFKHGYERYIAMRSDPALCFLDRCGQPNQMEIARENNDDFNDSQLDVENVDGTDIQDDLKPSGSGMKDDLNDSLDMNEKEESLSSFPPSRTGSPAPNKPMQGLNANTDLNAIIPCEPGKLLFPQAPDLNTRLRRLVATFQRNHKRQQMKLAKKEKREHVKKIRFEEQLRQRELRKLEHAQKWSRREEADFYRILAAYGVEMDTQTGKYNWTSFKKLAKLEKKYDDRMQEYYEHFRVMCLKVLKKEDQIPEGWDTRAPPEFSIEGISEERANKCLHRIDLLLKIRNEVLPHPDRDRRLKKCRRSMELPEWWELGKHDRDLIIGTARYGINRTESQLSMLNDPDLSFQELKEKYPKWHLPASAFFPPAPPKVAKKEKTDKDTPASTSGAPAEGSEKLADGNTSENPETSVKTEAENNTTANTETKVDPDTGEGSNPVEMGDSESNGCDPDQGNASQSSSQLSIGGQINNESLSQDIPMSSQDVESLQGTQNSSQNHVSSAQSSQDIFMSSQEQNEDAINGDEDLKQEIKTESEDVKLEIKSETNDDESKERTSSDIEGGVPQRELCRPPDDTGNASNENQEAKQFQPEFNPAEFLRWPKDRVIVHRLEQLSHCVLKGEWPGRKRHHHPGDPNRNGGEGRGEGIMGLPEHNYAGDDGREDTKTILPKKKKRRKRAEIEQERAAQLAILLGQNPSLGLHPVFSSLMTSLPALAGAQLPANMAAAALSPMDLSSQNPTAAGTSQYHIQDAEFRPDDPTGMQAALLAAGNLAGMQQVMHKKKKKHKKLDPLADTLDPEAAERRRKRKLELVEKKRRRKKKQKDKAKEMSDAFNALKDDDHVPVMNPRTGERYIGQAAPMKKQLGGWMKEHEGFELLYPFHAVVSPDGTSVSFPPLPKPAKTEEPPKKKKKKSQRNPAKLDPAKLTGQEHVDVVDRNTGRRLPYKLTPTLSNLGKWLQLNPAYDVTSEWGSIVKEKGYIGEDLHNRVSLLSMKTSTAPVQANTAGASTSQAAILGSPASKLSMQIGQSSLGGLGSLGIAGFANQQQLGTNSAAVTNAAQQLVNMQAAALQDKQKAKTPSKKKKLKTSHPIASISKPVVVSSPPPVSGVPSLAGISPYLLPTQGGVFYSPFLASHNVQGLISATTTTTNSTNSMDNESQSSADSKLARTEESVDMEETVEINFADANVNTFAGVDLGDLDGELEENVISDIAMEEEVQ